MKENWCTKLDKRLSCVIWGAHTKTRIKTTLKLKLLTNNFQLTAQSWFFQTRKLPSSVTRWLNLKRFVNKKKNSFPQSN